VTPLVVDASVVIKWLLPEMYSNSARRVLTEDHTLCAPDLLWAELGNALWKRVRAGEIAAEDGRDLLRDFRRLPVVTTPSVTLIDAALEIATALDRTVYDSLYLALAIGKRCRLVTADRRLYTALKSGPVATTLVWVEDVS
jgi:predicted nucleic acid-binding protein